MERISTKSGYTKIMWGILLSSVHIDIFIGIFCVQLIPMFLGLGFVMVGCLELRDRSGIDFFDKSTKDSMIATGIALATWLVGFIFSYKLLITKALMLLVYVMALSVYGELLNKTVRLYKLEGMIKEADRLRSDRMTFIKIYIAGLAIYVAGLIPGLEFIGQYVSNSVMFIINLWLSMIVQNIGKKDVMYHPQF